MGCEASRSSEVSPVNNAPAQLASSRYSSQQSAPKSRPHKPVGKVRKKWKWPEGAITESKIAAKREEFWESRTEGREETWQNLRGVANAMCGEDYELANALLQAAEITCPDGTLGLCYDGQGREYSVPKICYSKPSNISAESKGCEEKTPSPRLEGEELKDPTLQMDEKVVIHLKIRITNEDITVPVRAWKNCDVRDAERQLSRKLLQMDGFAYDSEPVCLFYMGKKLIRSEKLSVYGVKENHILLGHVQRALK